MAVFTSGGFGSGQRLSATGFIVLGLITFWVYSVLRFATVLRAHCERRWRDIESREDLKGVEPSRLAAFRARGFAVSNIVPRCAATLYAFSAMLVALWFGRGVVLGDIYSYAIIIGTVGLSSALFYAATLIVMLWALDGVRRHETNELLVREVGAGALLLQTAELGDEMVRRWEQQANKITLFLVVAFPMVFSPTLGAHLFLSGTVLGHELILPALCFSLAAVFHVWGTILLVDLYNGHLEYEARQVMPVAMVPTNDEQIPVVTESQKEDAAPRRELAAIMLTDICGYSKAMEHDEARAYTNLVEHNRIMRDSIAAHHGREIKTIGDAFLVIFRSAIDAVDCALAAQRSFADLNLDKNEADRILVRIGIHLGDVLITGDDVFGDGVNVAARIEPHAEPGGICISQPVFEMVRKKLQLEVSKVEGAKMKNIAVAPDLYRIRLGS